MNKARVNMNTAEFHLYTKKKTSGRTVRSNVTIQVGNETVCSVQEIQLHLLNIYHFHLCYL